MASKSLELQVSVRANQAETALRGITSSLNKAEQETKQFTASSEKASTAVSKVGSATTNASGSVSRYWGLLEQAGVSASRSFSNFSSALWKTAGQFMSLIKYASVFATATLGLGLWKVMSDFSSFSGTFDLMNATLKAKMPETISMVKAGLFDISNSSGKQIEEINDAFTQLLSSGMMPTAAEGTAEYTAQMEEALAVQQKLAESARATGENVRLLWDATVFAANSLGLDIRNLEDVDHIMNIFASTLDVGIGTMSQYSGQFSKFVKEAKQAWMSEWEMFWIFAKLTKVMDPEMAGFTTAWFARFFNNLWNEARQGAQNIARNIKWGWWTKGELNILEGMDTQGEFEDKLYYHVNEQGQKVKNSFTEVIANIQSTLAQAPQWSKLYDTLLGSIGNDIVVRKALANIANDKDLGDLREMMTNIQKWIDEKAMAKKIETMNDSMSVKMAQFKTTMRNRMTETADAMAPAIWVLMDMLSGAFWADSNLNDEYIWKAFAQARQNLAVMAPAMIPVLDALEKFIGFMRSDEWTRFVDSIMKGFSALWSMLMTVWKTLGAILANPMFLALMNTLAANPMLIAWGMFWANLLRTMWGGWWGIWAPSTSWAGFFWNYAWGGMLMWNSFMGTISKSLAWAWIAYAIGGVLWNLIEQYTDDQIKKVEASLKEAKETLTVAKELAKIRKWEITWDAASDVLNKADAELSKNMNISPAMLHNVLASSVMKWKSYEQIQAATSQLQGAGVSSANMTAMFGTEWAVQLQREIADKNREASDRLTRHPLLKRGHELTTKAFGGDSFADIQWNQMMGQAQSVLLQQQWSLIKNTPESEMKRLLENPKLDPETKVLLTKQLQLMQQFISVLQGKEFTLDLWGLQSGLPTWIGALWSATTSWGSLWPVVSPWVGWNFSSMSTQQ